MKTAAPDGVDAFKAATRAKLCDVRCPIHRQPPRIRFEGQSLQDVTVNLSGCCDRLITLANRAIYAQR